MKFCRISLTSDVIQFLYDDRFIYNDHYFTIYNDWLYFRDQYTRICRMKLDGKDQEVVFDNEGHFINSGLCIFDDWIYFYMDVRENGVKKKSLCRIYTDGSFLQVLEH